MRAPGCSRWLSVNNGTPFLTFLCVFGCEQALPRHHRPGAWEAEMQPSPFPRWQRSTSRAAGPGSEPAGYPTQGAQPAGHPRRLARAFRAPSRAIARPMLPPQLPRITGQYPKESRQTVVVLFLKFLDPTPSPRTTPAAHPAFVFARATQPAPPANRRATLHTYGLLLRDSASWLEPRRGPYVLGVYQTRP